MSKKFHVWFINLAQARGDLNVRHTKLYGAKVIRSRGECVCGPIGAERMAAMCMDGNS